jgi:hypothetical protein
VPGAPNVPATPTTQQFGGRAEATEKAGLAEIDPQFDLNAGLLDNLMRILSGEGDKPAEVPYYTGGKVSPDSDIDEIIRLLRG